MALFRHSSRDFPASVGVASYDDIPAPVINKDVSNIKITQVPDPMTNWFVNFM